MNAKLEVVIAGAGVAGLETAFALNALAGGRVAVKVISPQAEFLYRPQAVPEPFTETPSQRFPLSEIVAAAGAHLIPDSFAWLDAPNRIVHTRGGLEVRYGALVLALGARRRQPFRHATTIDETRLPAQLSGLLGEVEAGAVRSVAAVIPSTAGWHLPMYAFALRLASGSRTRGADLELTLATPEDAPLEIFGTEASQAVARTLAAAGVRIATSVSCEVPAPGVVSLRPGTVDLAVDRVLAQSRFFGPSTPGVPKRARNGFVAVDPFGRVRGLSSVYAAGDMTDFPVKLGAVAGEQADTAAAFIASSTGADVRVSALAPVIHGALLAGEEPLYMTAELIGSEAHRSEVGAIPSARPVRLPAPHLAKYLDAPARSRSG